MHCKLYGYVLLPIIFLYLNTTKVDSFFREPYHFLEEEKNLSIIDLRHISEFKKSHIKGAINLKFEELWEIFTKDFRLLFNYFSSLGLTAKKKVVIAGCDLREGYIDCLALAAILHYGGFDKIVILSGDVEEWKKANLPLTATGEAITPTEGNFKYRDEMFLNLTKKRLLSKKKYIALILDDNVKISKIFSKKINISFYQGDSVKDFDEMVKFIKDLQLSKESALIIYPHNKRETYALFYLLKGYFNYPNVFILKEN